MGRRGRKQAREKSVKEENSKECQELLKHLNPEENCKEETIHDPNGWNRVVKNVTWLKNTGKTTNLGSFPQKDCKH